MFDILTNLFSKKSDRDVKTILPVIKDIHAAYEHIEKLSTDELRAKTEEFKEKIKQHIATEQSEIDEIKKSITDNPEMDLEEKDTLWNQVDEIENKIDNRIEEVLDQILPEAFSVMKETAKRFKENEKIEVIATQHDRDLAARMDNVNISGDKAIYDNSWEAGGNRIVWDMVHYEVQLIGGVVLHKGKIAEMATGEGKTLVATLPVYLNALAERGVHLVTVNDYLARRDSEWMGMMFEFHGLTVDCIDKHDPNSEERRAAYNAHVTYGTNNEFGFDYLRDNMATEPEELVQRKHHYSIVDEVDSVLIDDARTPLIISGPTPRGDKQEFNELKPYVQKLFALQKKLATNFLAEAKKLLVDKDTDKEKEKEGFRLLYSAFRALPKNRAIIKFLSEPGIRAGMQKTENFYMGEQMKNMHLIDDQLYFTIDEKSNSIDLVEKGLDLITEETGDPEFYILPDIGMDINNLEKTIEDPIELSDKKAELIREYTIKTERVHTMNQLMKAYTLFENDVEYVVIENKIKIVDEQTGRIMEGRRYSDGLHQAIEAKENVKVEAATQTYATITLQNFFRMYHKLSGMTGTAETEAGEFWDIYKLDVTVIPTNRPITRNDEEDLVFKTVREKYNAVSEEILKLVNQKRPVLVGTTSVEVSELLSRMLNRNNIKHNVLNAKLHEKEALIVKEAGHPGTVTIATNMAGRGTDIKLGDGVKNAGGLAIIGTERHDSRRVDRQLRGRAGRQGDPGSSQFFVSLEDNLMRLFGSERIAGVMDRLGLEEGEVIQHSMISKSIERAQKKVEENNFGIRKRLLEYDDVMNKQRTAIYDRRRNALYGERLSLDISNMIYDLSSSITEEFHDARDIEGFNLQVLTTLGVDFTVSKEEFTNAKPAAITDLVYKAAYDNYLRKGQRIAEQVFPVVKDVYETNGTKYRNIAIPITDGVKTRNIVTNLEEAYTSNGKSMITSVEKFTTLRIIDEHWKEHLREMDDLRQSVQNASYEQKDPLLIYKFESFDLFQQLIQKINQDIVAFLIQGNLPENKQAEVQTHTQPAKMDFSKLQTGREAVGSKFGNKTQEKKTTQPVKKEKKVGRNDLCPCGSGQKYKHCHGN